MAVSKPLLTEFGIHERLESCESKCNDNKLTTPFRFRRDELLPQKMKENNAIYKRYNVEWIGREGLAPETHEEYLNDFINHFYKNVLKLVDRAMRKEDTSAQVMSRSLKLFSPL